MYTAKRLVRRSNRRPASVAGPIKIYEYSSTCCMHGLNHMCMYKLS
jgi:hypothetical protein